MRICTACGKGMVSGYCIEMGEAYYCSDACLEKEMTREEFLELYNEGNGDSYWTTWECGIDDINDEKEELMEALALVIQDQSNTSPDYSLADGIELLLHCDRHQIHPVIIKETFKNVEAFLTKLAHPDSDESTSILEELKRVGEIFIAPTGTVYSLTLNK